jgi:hemerythrin
MPVEWGSKYVFGLNNIDEQHMRLFGLINSLEKSVREGNAREVVGKVIDDLVGYTATHFSFEEALLRRSGYPDYASHIKEHEELLTQVSQFKRGHDAGKSLMTMEVMGFLVNWLAKHIDQTDRRYVPFLRGGGDI